MTAVPYCVHSLAVRPYRVGTQLLCGSCAEALMESEFPYPIGPWTVVEPEVAT